MEINSLQFRRRFSWQRNLPIVLRTKRPGTNICSVKDFHMVVHASLLKLLSLHDTNGYTERETAKYGTAPAGVAIHTEFKQEGKNHANTQ